MWPVSQSCCGDWTQSETRTGPTGLLSLWIFGSGTGRGNKHERNDRKNPTGLGLGSQMPFIFLVRKRKFPLRMPVFSVSVSLFILLFILCCCCISQQIIFQYNSCVKCVFFAVHFGHLSKSHCLVFHKCPLCVCFVCLWPVCWYH